MLGKFFFGVIEMIFLYLSFICSATPIKRTSVEKMTNVQILFLFGLLIVLSVACAVGTLIIEVSFCCI
jgi:hypothetical protein